jgi:nitric oxide reductase NorQ protein
MLEFAKMTRNLKENGLEERTSTRLLVHAAKLIVAGVNANIACRSAIAQALTDYKIHYESMS